MDPSSLLAHNRFDQLSKHILRSAFSMAGDVANQHEVSAGAQEIDTWFKVDPARAAALDRLGLLGRMIDSPATLFEAFHEAPSVDDYRDCQRKQLTIDHVERLAARRHKQPRPPFPRLWILASGRPEKVIRGYGLAPMPGFPVAVLEGREEERTGLVVLRELPRTRETLLLRLLGAGDLLREAIAELARLPEDAWERQVAMPPLIAFRFQIPQDCTDAKDKEYLMSTQELYEQWERQVERKGLERGLERGMKKGLLKLYQARFGGMPPAIASAIEAMHDPEALERWLDLFGVKSPEEIAAALHPAAEPGS